MNDDQDSGGNSGKVRWDDVPPEVKNDAAGLIGLVGTPLLAFLQAADPYCGTILAQNFEGVVDATLPLILRSEKVIGYFTKDRADWLLWTRLGMALAPVARAVWDHHIARTVTVVRDEHGVPHIVRGRQPESDHLTPPVPDEFNYAA